MMYGDQPLPGQNVIGTLYVTLNSDSGSKYYALQAIPETYAAVREQLNVPTFSKIDVTPETLTISTYRTDTMEMTDTYTILRESQEPLNIGQVMVTADGKTLDSENPDAIVTLNVTAESSNGTVELIVPVQSALDDMEERMDGSLDYDSSDLEITWENPTETDVMNQLIGIRFADLAIPQGATITDAYIQFSVDEPNKGFDPFDVDIYAEDVADSAAIENVNFVISGKFANRTTDYVQWTDVPMWTV